MFSLRAKPRPIPSISASDSSKFQFHIGFRSSTKPVFCLFFMARRQFPNRSLALAASFRVRRPPNAPFVLSCPPDTPRLQCGCRRRHTGFPSASSRSRQFRAHSTPIPSSKKKTQATFSSKKAQETLGISSSIFLVATEVEPLNKRLSEVHSSVKRLKSDSRCP